MIIHHQWGPFRFDNDFEWIKCMIVQFVDNDSENYKKYDSTVLRNNTS